MFSFFNRGSGGRPYKVQNASGDVKKGVVADSLKTLMKKSRQMFEVKDFDKLVLQEDGTEVDEEDYFKTLPAQTVFVLLQKGENWKLDKSRALKSTLNALTSHGNSRKELLSELHNLMKLSKAPELIQLISSMTSSLETNIAAESREDDEEWFKGVDMRFKTKEDAMKDSARRRIRGYYYAAKDYAKANSKKSRETCEMIGMLLEQYKATLSKNDFYGHYFARSNQNQDQYCDCEGWFVCEGAFNEDSCDDKHIINPYASRSDRIVFSTWNLDHQIEKSREVLPCLWEAVSGLLKNSKLKLNSKYFYDLLFTRQNLRIVHIACHDKKEHSEAVCDTNKFYK